MGWVIISPVEKKEHSKKKISQMWWLPPYFFPEGIYKNTPGIKNIKGKGSRLNSSLQ